MKIRNGFVSNSSSSSFIVVFPHDPVDADDVRTMMFQGNDAPVQPYDCAIPARAVAEDVWQDIERQRKRIENPAQFADYYSDYEGQDDTVELLGGDKVEALLSQMCFDCMSPEDRAARGIARPEEAYSGYYFNEAVEELLGKEPSYTAPVDLIRAYAQKELELKLRYGELVHAEIEKFAAGGVVYKFHYCDEGGGWGSAMEHGDIFRKLKHTRISHH